MDANLTDVWNPFLWQDGKMRDFVREVAADMRKSGSEKKLSLRRFVPPEPFKCDEDTFYIRSTASHLAT